MVMYPRCSRMLQHNPSSKLSPLCDCVTTQEHPPPLIDKGGIENMVGEGELPEMKIHREVMRLRICLRWELMPAGLSWWMRTTLATEHNSAAIEAIKQDLLKLYGIRSVCAYVRAVGLVEGSAVKAERGCSLRPIWPICSSPLEECLVASSACSYPETPGHTWDCTQAAFCGLPGTRRTDKSSCSA